MKQLFGSHASYLPPLSTENSEERTNSSHKSPIEHERANPSSLRDPHLLAVFIPFPVVATFFAVDSRQIGSVFAEHPTA
jgi:hypothetical protein